MSGSPLIYVRGNEVCGTTCKSEGTSVVRTIRLALYLRNHLRNLSY